MRRRPRPIASGGAAPRSPGFAAPAGAALITAAARGILATGALAAAVAAIPGTARAQSPRFDAISPVTGQPDNPGVGQDVGPNGLPMLRRRLGDGLARGDSPSRGDTLSRDTLGGTDTSGTSTAGEGPAPPPTQVPVQGLPAQPGLSQLDTRVTTGGQRTGGGTSTSNNAGLSTVLRQRAAPPRRIGSATRRQTQDATRIPTPALRLTPVVQEAVSGVPLAPAVAAAARARTLLPLGLPISSPALGLLTPGFILGTDIARSLPPDPAYAPLGIKMGTFTLLPTFAQSIGYDTNPDQTNRQAARSSVALRTEGGLDFYGESTGASLAGSLRGAYLETPQNEAASRPAADGAVRARLNATRDLQFDAETRFLVDTQRTTSANLQAATATSRPLFAVYGGSLGATQTFNRLSVSLRGSIDRSQFDNAQLSNGTVINQADRNLNQYSLDLRAGYEVTPDFSPYVDLLLDTRVYDSVRDAGGVRRDSNGVALTAGAAFGIARSLTGTIGAGIQYRTYEDPTLRNIAAPLINASLVWTASPLTTVRFTAATGVSETTLPGSSGILTDVGTLEIQHNLLRNLAIIVGGSFLRNDYQSSTTRETGYSATARLEYAFTRWLTLRGTYIYQRIDSNVAGASFRDNTVLVGVRVNP